MRFRVQGCLRVRVQRASYREKLADREYCSPSKKGSPASRCNTASFFLGFRVLGFEFRVCGPGFGVYRQGFGVNSIDSLFNSCYEGAALETLQRQRVTSTIAARTQKNCQQARTCGWVDRYYYAGQYEHAHHLQRRLITSCITTAVTSTISITKVKKIIIIIIIIIISIIIIIIPAIITFFALSASTSSSLFWSLLLLSPIPSTLTLNSKSLLNPLNPTP